MTVIVQLTGSGRCEAGLIVKDPALARFLERRPTVYLSGV
jgi:hypothetical protein